ncbi:SusC/RagA family TonB-linked outer membrane protein [Fulvitalea axinellae]|uniref:SusC/RagA family TonB-linked outer membrane protein n=1 Tax=Fulvitalea axinellae TaxID=1182444 RepID=A0AAU9CU46_9BACT|nr:SusC/RagA family TonB-linked outer membrane protein [Fulvitalea axinellae]
MALAFLWSFSAVAQKGQLVQGYVKDAKTGEGLPGVTVVEVDQEERFVHGVVTDLNGFYMIKLTENNSKLQFTSVGYKRIMQPVNGSSKIDIGMREENTELEVVTVQGERFTSDGFIAIRDKATAISQVKLDDLDALPVASVDEMLQGQISGVDITAVSGDPGAGMQIRIRGTATINGDREPLIILDGLPYDVQIDNDFDFNSADNRDYGAMLSIAPDDIETVEILKDAASAAIWGAKAANGIIQITTRRGRKMKPQLRYSYKSFVSVQPDPVPMLSGGDYVTLQKEARFNRNAGKTGDNFPELNYDETWEYYYNYSQNTDWLDEITQMGTSGEHNVSLTGGGEKARYRVGLGYFDQEGTTTGTGLQRLTFRSNLDYTVSTRLVVSSDFSYTRSDNQRSYYGNERSLAYRKMPNQSVYEYDTLGVRSDRYFLDPRAEAYQGRGMYNPVAVLNEARHSYLENRLRSVFRVNYSITDYLTLTSNLSFDLVNGRTKLFMPEAASNAYMNESGINKSSEGSSDIFTTQTLTKLIYTPNLGADHQLTVLGQWQTRESRSSSYSATAGGLPSQYFDDPGAGGGRVNALSSSNGRSRSMGAVLNGHYKWKDRYILGGGARVDASSNFGDGTKWGMFPFASAAWRISEEDFLSEVMWVNDIKIRGSYGVNGRAPSGNSHYSIYKTGSQYMFQPNVYPSNVKLNNLRWEKVVQYNLGFESALFDNRLHMEFDVYRKTSTDLLWTLELPTATGYSALTRNQGGLDNKGIELSLRGEVYKTKDWRVNLQFNISKNINTVEEVPDNFRLERGNLLENGNYATHISEGDPIGGFYGYTYKGVYKRNEDAVVYDKFGEVVIDQNTGKPMRMMMKGSNYVFQGGDAIYGDRNYDGFIDESDVVFLGSSNPEFTGGFGVRVQYKGLSVSSNFHYRVGQDIVNMSRMKSENMYNTDNQSTATMRRWRFPGDDTDIPRAVFSDGYNWLGSDRFVENGSYLRWKNLSFNYRFDKKWLRKYSLSDLSVFFTAYNLYTFTNYTGQDPEVPLGTDPFFFGIDNATTPPSRTYTMGLTVIF